MERAHLPTLELDNFPIWLRTLEVLASDLRLDDHLNPSTPAPTDPSDFANYKRQQDRLSLIILSSLPKSITSTLPPESLRLPPHLFLQKIRNTVTELTTIDPTVLEDEARSITLNIGDTIDDYIQRHTTMRSKMRSSEFPNISNESTTIRFMIHGIRNDPDHQLTHAIFSLTPPTTIHEFTTAMRRAQANTNTKTLPTNTHPPHYAFPRPFIIPQHLPLNRNKTPATRPAHKQPKWCSYHNSSTHTNVECRAQRNRKLTPQANIIHDQFQALEAPIPSPYSYDTPSNSNPEQIEHDTHPAGNN